MHVLAGRARLPARRRCRDACTAAANRPRRGRLARGGSGPLRVRVDEDFVLAYVHAVGVHGHDGRQS